jgi:hypothetical protein
LYNKYFLNNYLYFLNFSVTVQQKPQDICSCASPLSAGGQGPFSPMGMGPLPMMMGENMPPHMPSPPPSLCSNFLK